MRISTSQFHDGATQRLIQANGQAARTQEQISSGKRLLAPGDDPTAAVQIARLERSATLRERHLANVDRAEVSLQREETVLSRVGEIYQRMRELVVQAGGAALTAPDRQLIATEVEGLLGELETLANARDLDGQYLFSGSASTTKPFVGGEFQGARDARQVEIGNDRRMTVSDSGFDVFENVDAVGPRFVISEHPDNTSIPVKALTARGVVDPEALSAVHPGRFEIRFSATGYTVTDVTDGTVVEQLDDVPFAPGDEIEFAGMRIGIAARPADGDRYVVDTVQRQSVFASVQEVIRGLRDSSLDGEAVAQLVDDGLGNIDAALQKAIDVRTKIGTRLATLDETRQLHLTVGDQETSLLSDLRDLDYAEAVSRLSFQTFLIEASQASFARLANLSLFDRL